VCPSAEVGRTDDRRFRRRVGAVLVAEHDAATTPSGEAGAHVVTDAVRFLRIAGGDAEALAGNAVVAVFDEPAEAVTAATRLHLQGTGGEAGRWRAGVYAADLEMTGEGSATLAAIDRAMALARVARRGTTAVTTDAIPALRHFREATLEPLDAIDVPGMPRGSVYLVVPRWSAPVLPRRRIVALLAGAAIVGGTGAIAWIATRRRRGGAEPRKLTIGVGPFRSSGLDEASAWIAPAVRDGINTQLTELSGVRVFSDEFMDFVMTREHLTVIEVAQRLGITKMVSGSVVTVGDMVRVEFRVVDVATGVLDGARVESGRAKEFLALESDLVVDVIASLPISLSTEEESRIAARRATDLDMLRRLLDAEGESQVAPSPEATPGGSDDGHSWFIDLLGPREAQADEAPREITAFLEQYRRATEARDVDALGAMYAAFSPAQRAAIERYFGGVRDLRIGIDHVEAAVVGDEAVVSYSRTDDFVDVQTGRPGHVSERLTKTLRRVDGRWLFASSR
jgi:TolB-like protein/ketosteroid isomerase-like protein